MPELDINGIIEESLSNALQRSSVQGDDWADVFGLTEEIIAQRSRSHPPAAVEALAVADERVPFWGVAVDQPKEDGQRPEEERKASDK